MSMQRTAIGAMRGTYQDDISKLIVAIQTAGKCRRRVVAEYDPKGACVRFFVTVPMPRAVAEAADISEPSHV